ncbi:glycosyltransferase [Maribellus comscasis]|uniref:Glycosyltransferase n=1 Tax=Maribellus comscasis TaxID=2681766 RepID=A0A6I6JW11_9BACT|nr:glycosyltransferase family 2 protein [Maribellus comscasis]QGY45288.1 glycosyltransferase [Maribellus comscasis]
MFAEKYLLKQDKKSLIGIAPKAGTKLIVVIPCYNEPDILQTLVSLSACKIPDYPVEVLIVLNHSETENDVIKDFNWKTKKQVEFWLSENKFSNITFYIVGPVELRKKWAGAGLARKTGMDEALFRFDLLKNPNGLIVSLDADTLVAENYFVEIEKHFSEHPKNVGATISFQHQTTGLEARHLKGIQLYEKYLWFYKNAIHFTGYPYSMFTVGSAFAVKAEAYVKRGGMNRRQAGEDFYFLQNLAQLGEVGEISTTKVYPSARLSARVPFGTGPILQKWMNETEDLTQTYNFQAFADLKELFDTKGKLFKINKKEYEAVISKLPEPVFEFLLHDNFWKELNDVNNNCANQQTFKRRFFQKFNAFKILKYLNFVHEEFYLKANLNEQVDILNRYLK